METMKLKGKLSKDPNDYGLYCLNVKAGTKCKRYGNSSLNIRLLEDDVEVFHLENKNKSYIMMKIN